MTQVLVVDDRDDNRYLLRTLLHDHGYTVDEAHHGAEALARARSQPPDVVVSDLLMPVMDGYTLLRQWKADPALKHCPFIVYTATYTDPKDERLALDLGADAFIRKPTANGAFVLALQQVLAADAAQPAVPTDSADTLERYNTTLVRKLEQKAAQLEQRAAEAEAALRALAASEARFRAVFDHSVDLILLSAPDGRVLAANPAACLAFGLDEAQVCARGRAGLIDTADPRLPALLAERAATGRARGELTLLRGDGSRFPVELTSTVYHDAQGEPHACIIARDISGRLQAEAALRASYARVAELQAAVDAHALVSMTDAEGRITFANERFCAVSGYTHDELLGHTHRLISSGVHDRAFYGDLWATVSTGKVWHGEICNRAKDGALYWVDATIYPFMDDAGQPYQYAAIRTDITERKRGESARAELEAQLRQAQKMEAIGTLAGGVAHDFNNVLGAILGYAALAQQDAAAGQPVDAALAQIRAAGTRARSLVQRILAFTRQQVTALKVQPLQPLVHEAVALLRGTLPASVQLHTELPETPVQVLADATQVEQVLLNLATNAWHALPEHRGQITLGLRAVALPQDRPLPPLLPAGRYAHLWVSDDGCGMDAATLARIFEPFFTTKPTGAGTGLGLATVYRIVETHHGAITVDTAPGQGSTFHVLLPLADAPAHSSGGGASTMDAPFAPPVPAMGDRHVLYIDDDETIALLAEHLLRRAGYRATIFSDAAQALTALRANPRAFDAVITDYHMPGTTGLDVARTLARVAPGVPVLIGSGYVDAALRDAAAAAGVRGLLHKERLVEDLVPMLQAALAATPVN